MYNITINYQITMSIEKRMSAIEASQNQTNELASKTFEMLVKSTNAMSNAVDKSTEVNHKLDKTIQKFNHQYERTGEKMDAFNDSVGEIKTNVALIKDIQNKHAKELFLLCEDKASRDERRKDRESDRKEVKLEINHLQISQRSYEDFKNKSEKKSLASWTAILTIAGGLVAALFGAFIKKQ
ncbi:MAG: hypothetical protein ACJAYB_000071 [Psychromonas sp.]|jgi:hypothetical protein